MKIVYIVFGGYLLSAAIRATPGEILLWQRDDSDSALMCGSSGVVVLCYILGILLLRAGIRRHYASRESRPRREGKPGTRREEPK